MENTNEVFKKEYTTKELRQKIENQINNKYEEFSDIIVDITLKRAYTFGFSEEEILKDVDSLLKNCDKIKFSKNFSSPTVMGHVILSKKLLEINASFFQKDKNYEKMYEVLTHEIYHDMSAKEDDKTKIKYTGLQFIDELGKKRGIMLNEVFNECAADLATITKKSRDEENLNKKTIGYSSYTFVVPMLANALGVSVNELTKVGISSRENLIKFMLSKIPSDEKEEFFTSFDKFEYHLDQLKLLNSKKSDELSEDDKLNLENSHNEISNFAINLLYGTIIKDNREISKELQLEYEYRRRNVSKIIRNNSENFKSKLQKGAPERMIENVSTTSLRPLNSLITVYNHLSRIKDLVSKEDLEQLRNKVNELFPQKKIKLFGEFEKNLIGTTYVQPRTVSECTYDMLDPENSYRQHIIEDDYNSFEVLDNNVEIEKLQELFEKHLKLEASKDNIEDPKKKTEEVEKFPKEKKDEMPKKFYEKDQNKGITLQDIGKATSSTVMENPGAYGNATTKFENVVIKNQVKKEDLSRK